MLGITIEIPADSQRRLGAIARLAILDQNRDALGRMVEAAAQAGADRVAQYALAAELGFTPRHGGQGLAGAVEAWMIDRSIPLAAFGVPANSPAAAYAGILERGGTITPKRARALAVPISEEAKRHDSPREMAGLFLLKRPGKPPLLCEQVGKGLMVHWVLVASVTIEARHWLSRGAERARPEMNRAAQDALGAWARATTEN